MLKILSRNNKSWSGNKRRFICWSNRSTIKLNRFHCFKRPIKNRRRSKNRGRRIFKISTARKTTSPNN